MGSTEKNICGRSMAVWLGIYVLMLFPIGGHVFGAGLAVSSASPNSVTLTWTAPGDDGDSGTATQYDIRYSLSIITDANWDATSQAVGEPTPQSGGNAEAFDVIGLQPNTTYYFAIKTADEIPNWSALSNVISRTTDPEATPPVNVADLSAGNPTPDALTLSWTAPGDDGNSGTATSYDIRYSTANITDLNWDAATQASDEPTPQPAGSSEGMIISGLNPETTYYFAIKTADEVPNWSGLSNIASAATLPVPTVPDPPVLASPSNGATDLVQPVTMDWGDISGVDSYQLQLDEAASFVSPITDTSLSLSLCNVSGLGDGTQYYWRVRAHNSVGWSNWSTVWNFTTECPLPEAPLLVSPDDGAINITMPVNLDWTDIAAATQYQVQVDESSGFGSPVINISTSGSNYSASGLNDQTTYYWRVRSNDNCGWSDWSAVRDFNTIDTTIPLEVANLTAIPGFNDDEVVLAWTATGDDGAVGTATQYDIRYSESVITEANWSAASQVSGEPTPQTAGLIDSMTIGNLKTNTKYYFALKVADEAGNWSALSNVAETTPNDHTAPAAIDDLTAETGSDDGVVFLSWTAPGDDGDVGIVSAYLIRYAQQPLNEGNWDAADLADEFVTPLPAGLPQSVMLAGLNPGELYYFGIKSYDDNMNASGLSNIAPCTSGVDLGVDVEDGQVAAVGPATNSILHSSQPTLSVTNIGISEDNQYYFEVAVDSYFISLVARSSPIAQMGGGGDITSWPTDEKLEGGQTYYWRAKANNNSYCAAQSFTLQPMAHAYPNPFRLSDGVEVTFVEVPQGSDLILTSVSGTIIRRWTDIGSTAPTWDGANESGHQVASGTYLWFVENADLSGKLVVIR
jgi:hypothetical protein